MDEKVIPAPNDTDERKIPESRESKQEKILARLGDLNTVEDTTNEIKRQMGDYRMNSRRETGITKEMPEDDKRSLARGHLFEKIAIAHLHEQNKPPDPELSDAILEIVRSPSKMIQTLEQRLGRTRVPKEYEAIRKEFEEEKKAGKFDKLKRHPKNNDSIALDIIEDEVTGIIKATVLGSYEVKNYQIDKEYAQEQIKTQLEGAKEAAVSTIEELGKYIPLFLLLHGHSNIPGVVETVSREDFKQKNITTRGSLWE